MAEILAGNRYDNFVCRFRFLLLIQRRCWHYSFFETSTGPVRVDSLTNKDYYILSKKDVYAAQPLSAEERTWRTLKSKSFHTLRFHVLYAALSFPVLNLYLNFFTVSQKAYFGPYQGERDADYNFRIESYRNFLRREFEYQFRSLISDPRDPVSICQIESLILVLFIGENMADYDVDHQVFQRALRIGRCWLQGLCKEKDFPRGFVTHFGLTRDTMDW